LDPALEKLFNTPIKITIQSKRIIISNANFVTTYLQNFLVFNQKQIVDFGI